MCVNSDCPAMFAAKKCADRTLEEGGKRGDEMVSFKEGNMHNECSSHRRERTRRKENHDGV
ncbi:hypothetical protein KSF_091300 [Reticulibacter mediterranei]|uniref:Uncharacterized protein n=1 Tax=Reticulibacter mediterranei TaxID=2778369 RepID=A0A8J3N5B1_9CHLR|nr:hypothetical protein KSF_091300 [Reticulibacter mediterranei]